MWKSNLAISLPNIMDVQTVWNRVLDEMEVSVTRPYFESYLKRLWVVEVENGIAGKNRVVVGCRTAFHQAEIEKRFGTLLEEAFEKILQGEVLLEFQVKKPVDEAGGKEEETPLLSFARSKSVESVDERLQALGLRNEYTLENFAVSSSNEMAYAAARAVAQNPGHAYNPLFLYGGVGVGKTHLMQAVGQAAVRERLDFELIYCSGEDFTNEIIEAIRKKSTPQFRKRYRGVNILLIDDIQFIAGKVAVQEEFFHTFNAITGEGGQVIMTADKSPKEIDLLEDRLRSRFEGGLAIDIGSPNFELRSAILMIKARQMGIDLSPEAAQEVAEFEKDTRAMLGLFMKMMAYASMKERPLDLELIREVLKVAGNEKQKQRGEIKPTEVIGSVAEYFQAEAAEIRGPRRVKSLTLPRHVAMYLLKMDFQLGLVEIGRWFNNRDHTSVMHAVAKVQQLLKNSPDLGQDLELIRKELYG